MRDWTASLQGVTIGAGTAYRWATMPAGLLGASNVRTGDVEWPRGHGVLAGDDWLGGRLITFDCHIIGSDAVRAEQAAGVLAAAFAPTRSDVILSAQLAGAGEYAYIGRPRGCDVQLDTKARAGVLRARCSFLATDPRRYGPLGSVEIEIPTGTDGLDVPALAPFVFGSDVGGEVSVTNAGTVDTEWSAEFVGPLTSPVLEIVGGSLIGLDLSIASGQSVFLDSRQRSVLLDDASRYSSLRAGSRWWQLPAGTSVLRLSGAGAGHVSFSYRSAYL